MCVFYSELNWARQSRNEQVTHCCRLAASLILATVVYAVNCSQLCTRTLFNTRRQSYATTVLLLCAGCHVVMLQFGAGLSRDDLLTWRGWAKNQLTHKALKAIGLAVRIWGNPWTQLRTAVGAPPVAQLADPASWPLLWQHSRLNKLVASFSSGSSNSAAGDSKIQQQQQQQQQQQALPICKPLVELHLNSFQVEPPRPMVQNRVRGVAGKLAAVCFILAVVCKSLSLPPKPTSLICHDNRSSSSLLCAAFPNTV
jgi:hypothetical protein